MTKKEGCLFRHLLCCFKPTHKKNEITKEGIPDHDPGSHRNHKGTTRENKQKKGCLHRQPYG